MVPLNLKTYHAHACLSLKQPTSANFVSPRLLQQLGITYSSPTATLRLADDSSAPILGKVRLKFKLQSFTCTVTCYVTDLCDEFDLILGNGSTDQHSADDLPDFSLMDDLAEAYAADPFFADEDKTSDLTFAEVLWWKVDRIVVPDSKDTKRLILQAFRNHPIGGHFGLAKKAIKSRFYWRHADKEVGDYVRNCRGCQVHTIHPSKPAGWLVPLDVPPYAWHTVTTDYITGLPLTPKGNNAIAVFVNKLTTYVYAVPCSDKSDAVDWANMSAGHVVQHEGLSTVIISD